MDSDEILSMAVSVIIIFCIVIFLAQPFKNFARIQTLDTFEFENKLVINRVIRSISIEDYLTGRQEIGNIDLEKFTEENLKENLKQKNNMAIRLELEVFDNSMTVPPLYFKKEFYDTADAMTWSKSVKKIDMVYLVKVNNKPASLKIGIIYEI